MQRLLIILATVAGLLGIGAPAVLAAEPVPDTGRILVSVNGPITVPAGDRLDTLVVVGGDAQVNGDVRRIVVVRGTATLAGATTQSLVIVDGKADLQAGTTVSGEVRTFHGTVTQQPGATVAGPVQVMDGEAAAFLGALGVVLLPLFFLFFIGMGLATIAAAVLVAAFASRQVRQTGALMRREPGPVIIAGILGSVVLPVLSFLLIATVIGAPIGLGLLLIVLPAVAFLAWIVAAIWIGDWMVTRMRGAAEPDRPYLAAVLGVIVLSFAGILPFVSAIATLFGFGALLLAAWRMLRREAAPAAETGPALAAPGAA